MRPNWRRAAGIVLATSIVLTCAAPTDAAMTIGQIGTPAGGGCGFQLDWLQPSVSSGISYVVPSTGGAMSWTVTSWDTSATGPAQLTLKFFRKVSDAATYQAVAHDGPRALVAGGAAANTFPTNLLVRSGDVLGFFTNTTDSCKATSTDSFLFGGPGGTTGLGDGASATFTTGTNGRLQVEATITPTNTFDLLQLRRNKTKGTAILKFSLPNPGELTATGRGAKARSTGIHSSKAVGAGPAELVVKAKGRKKRKLNERGKVKLSVSLTYTPNGGDPNTEVLPLVLKKNG